MRRSVGPDELLPLREPLQHLRRREPERLLLDPVDDLALLLVVMRRLREQRTTQPDQVARCVAEKAPQRERELHVVDDRRSPEDRRSFGADGETTRDGVAGRLAL